MLLCLVLKGNGVSYGVSGSKCICIRGAQGSHLRASLRPRSEQARSRRTRSPVSAASGPQLVSRLFYRTGRTPKVFGGKQPSQMQPRATNEKPILYTLERQGECERFLCSRWGGERRQHCFGNALASGLPSRMQALHHPGDSHKLVVGHTTFVRTHELRTLSQIFSSL